MVSCDAKARLNAANPSEQSSHLKGFRAAGFYRNRWWVTFVVRQALLSHSSPQRPPICRVRIRDVTILPRLTSEANLRDPEFGIRPDVFGYQCLHQLYLAAAFGVRIPFHEFNPLRTHVANTRPGHPTGANSSRFTMDAWLSLSTSVQDCGSSTRHSLPPGQGCGVHRRVFLAWLPDSLRLASDKKCLLGGEAERKCR